MSELAEVMEDDADDPPTLRSLRSEIERWLRVVGVPTRCACGCGEPHSELHRVCGALLLAVCQEPVESMSSPMWMEDDDEEDEEDEEGAHPFARVAEQHQWPAVLEEIWVDWIGEFAAMEPLAHPVRHRAFRWALYQMFVDDFVFDLRSQVEAQIARHGRRAIEAEQPDLFPEA
jgi:hypothetical protein